MSVEQNRTIGRRFFEEQDRRKGPPADELCAPDYRIHLASYPVMDLAGHKQFGHAFYAGFPDLRHTVNEVVATEDTATVRFTLTGTHTGNFMGIPATNRKINVSALALMHLRAGKITEIRGEFDALGMMQQLGVVPATA